MNPPNFTTWAEQMIILPDKKFVKFQPHQKVIFDHCLAFDDNGKLPYSVIVFSCPKKSGKTAINAMLQTYWAFEIEPPNEIITAANKREQAISRAFKEARGFIERNPLLLERTNSITKENLTLNNGSTILAIPNDFAGEAGSNHGLTCWDELWGFYLERDRRLYEELTPVPTRKNSIRLITTYAGFQGESLLLEEIYFEIFDEQGNIKPGIGRPLGNNFPVYTKGDLFVYWDHGTFKMPWQSQQYYASQRRSLRTNTYLRLHENRWVSSESGLFNMDEWDACVNPEHKPPLPDKSIGLWVGVDASTKKDKSAIVSVYRDGPKIKLGPKRAWQPTANDPMDLEHTMESYLMELNRGYRLISVRYDPFQFHRSAMTLAKRGLPMVESPQTSSFLTEIGTNIYDLVRFGNIVLYPCRVMRFEATCSVAKETARGFQIRKEKSTQKIDEIVSLAMSAIDAVRIEDQLFPGFRRAVGQN